MNIYQLTNNTRNRIKLQGRPVKLSGLKKAAGGEDMVHLTQEARERFTRNNVVKLQEQEMKNLALKHINDSSLLLENPGSDPEFSRAEKLVLMAELVARVIPSPGSARMYEKIGDFVVEQISRENRQAE